MGKTDCVCSPNSRTTLFSQVREWNKTESSGSRKLILLTAPHGYASLQYACSTKRNSSNSVAGVYCHEAPHGYASLQYACSTKRNSSNSVAGVYCHEAPHGYASLQYACSTKRNSSNSVAGVYCLRSLRYVHVDTRPEWGLSA